MKFKKSLFLTVHLILGIFSLKADPNFGEVYLANSINGETVSIPLPSQELQKILIKLDDCCVSKELTQQEWNAIVDHIAHVLLTYDGDILSEYAYKEGSIYYTYAYILPEIFRYNKIKINQKLINAAFEYINRSKVNYSRLLEYICLVDILDKQTTGKNSLNPTKDYILALDKEKCSRNDLPVLKWYASNTPCEHEAIQAILKIITYEGYGAWNMAQEAIEHARENFPTIDLTKIKKAVIDSDISSANDIDEIISLFPDLKTTFASRLINQDRYIMILSELKNRSFYRDIVLQRYLRGKKINKDNEEPLQLPLIKQLFSLQAHNEAQKLLPDYHELKQGPTKNYINYAAQKIHYDFDLSTTPSIYQLSKDLVTLENQESQRGYYTFANGGPKEMYPLQYWFTKLFEIKNNRELGDYLFTRFESDHSIFKKVFHAITRPLHLYIGSRSNVFMQYSLFKGWSGCNPAYFYLYNRKIIQYTNSIENIFNQLGYSNIYTQFKQEITELEKEYFELCPHGQVLLFSFSPEAVQKCVYVCWDGGQSRSVDILRKGEGVMRTSDVATIIDAFKSDPKSVLDTQGGCCLKELQFCFIPTIDYGLHPDIAGKDVRIFSLNGADPKKMEKYKAKENTLLCRIKKYIT